MPPLAAEQTTRGKGARTYLVTRNLVNASANLMPTSNLSILYAGHINIHYIPELIAIEQAATEVWAGYYLKHD